LGLKDILKELKNKTLLKIYLKTVFMGALKIAFEPAPGNCMYIYLASIPQPLITVR